MFSFYQRQTSHLPNSWLGLQIMQPVMLPCQRLLERLYMKILDIFFFCVSKMFSFGFIKDWIWSKERVRMWKDYAWPDIESCNLSCWLHTPNIAVMLKHRKCYQYYFYSVWNIFSFGFNKALDSRGINKKGIVSYGMYWPCSFYFCYVTNEMALCKRDHATIQFVSSCGIYSNKWIIKDCFRMCTIVVLRPKEGNFKVRL